MHVKPMVTAVIVAMMVGGLAGCSEAPTSAEASPGGQPAVGVDEQTTSVGEELTENNLPEVGAIEMKVDEDFTYSERLTMVPEDSSILSCGVRGPRTCVAQRVGETDVAVYVDGQTDKRNLRVVVS